jgi:hypothetical protein
MLNGFLEARKTRAGHKPVKISAEDLSLQKLSQLSYILVIEKSRLKPGQNYFLRNNSVKCPGNSYTGKGRF